MKVIVSQSSLNRLLQLASSISERRNTMPILANVKIKADGDELVIIATDLEISLVGRVKADVKESGSITVDSNVLCDIVRGLENADLNFHTSSAERLDILQGQSRYKLNGTSSEEFPSIKGTSLVNAVTVHSAKIYEMLEKTLFAVSQDETRYNLGGIYVEIVSNHQGSLVRFVATDGHRLALVDRPADGIAIPNGVIIPKKGAMELKKLLEGDDGVSYLSINEGFLTIECNACLLAVRLVDGVFPDYRQVIPSDSATTISVNRNDFLMAVKRVSLVTTDKSKTLRCKLVDGNFFVLSSSAEYGEGAESIVVEQEGENVTVGFSSRYLVDLLNANSASETMVVKFNGELGPVIFKGDDDADYNCIVMPMRFDK